MSKAVKYLGLALCVFGSLSAVANARVDDTQKTELILRDHRIRPAAFTTLHELKSKKNGNFSTKFQITGFYNETQNSSRLGEVFGANCKNCIKVGTQAQVDGGLADVENNFLLHFAGADLKTPEDNTLEGTISFNPKRTAYGTHVEAFVTLDKFLKGLYFKENLVVTYVKHDLGVKICDSKSGAASTESHTLADILSGKRLKRVFNTAGELAESEQAALHYAKICGSHDRTGINNIESILGWRFIDKKDYFLGVNAALHTPSGDRPTGEFLWEPRLGSSHWALGAGFEVGATLWENKDQTLKLFCNAQYRYQFEETEKRTLGIKGVLTNTKRCKHILSHYYLIAEDKKYMLHPAANILTLDVDVEPGSLVDGLLALNYNWGNLAIDLGYNLFWKERESVSLRACSWTDKKYAIAAFNWETCVADDPFSIFTVGPDESEAQPQETPINLCNIDTSVAETPDMLSHSIFGSVGYIFKEWSYPMMLALGGAYEFGDDRAAADSFTIWGKIGFAF